MSDPTLISKNEAFIDWLVEVFFKMLIEEVEGEKSIPHARTSKLNSGANPASAGTHQ
jgi:hypothetical protein